MKIKLVEDDQTMRSLLKTLLELEGHTVTICSEKDETDIVEQILNDLPEVVILDIHLARADGINILKNIRNIAGNSINVLMTSGLPMEKECLEAGADLFLIKPFLPDELVMSIRNLKRSYNDHR